MKNRKILGNTSHLLNQISMKSIKYRSNHKILIYSFLHICVNVSQYIFLSIFKFKFKYVR